MAVSNNQKKYSPILLEHLEHRLAPASSIFENQVTNLYRFGLNRSPEPEGLQAHVRSLEAGRSLHQVAETIFNSDEHHRSVITCFYRELLNREPDAAGMESFLGAARSGAGPEELLAGFLSSGEYLGAGVGDETYVDFLYQQVLGRAGDETGRAAQIEALQNGTSRFDVALGFLRSQECDASEVKALYRNILDRAPLDSEVNNWVDRMAKEGLDQDGLVVEFISSLEGGEKIGAGVIYGSDTVNEGWWLTNVGLKSLTVDPLGGPTAGQQEIQKVVNQIRANETFSNPTNMGQIVSLLRKDDYPDPNAKNNASQTTTGTFGASAYSEDLRNTPGAFQVDLANVGQFDSTKNNEVFGEWLGVTGSNKKPGSTDVEIAFTQKTLSDFLGIEVDANGLITKIGKEGAAVFLGNESLALATDFDPSNNPLIGQHIDSLKREQLSLYLAGRSPDDANIYMAQDVRVAPQNIVDISLNLQEQASKSYMYALLNKYASHPDYKATFEKAQALFGCTLQITSMQKAYGVNAGDVFWSRFNAGFVAGGGYVSGERAMFNLFQALVTADESPTGTGTWTIETKDQLGNVIDTILVNFKKIKDGPNAADKIFTVDKTPTNVGAEFPSIFHYGASLSTFAIDGLLKDPDSWGVIGRTAEMGYGRLGATKTITGSGTLESGDGAYSYQYQGMDNHQTIEINGPDAYRLTPVPTTSTPAVMVNNSGYSLSTNSSQSVVAGQKIDMSAYGKTIEQAYPDFYYVDTTQKPVVVAHVYDKSFVAPAWGLYLYYVNGAGGEVAKATDAIENSKISWQEPYKFSYRVSVANTGILGVPDSATQFGANFIMTPPPPPVQGSGVLDASSLTGSLRVQADTSIARVLLGQGSNQVDGGGQGAGVLYVVNSAMAPSFSTTVFRNLRLGIDKVDLTGFGTISNLAANVIGSFDNKVGSSSIAEFYTQYTNTVEVTFTAGGKSYKFQVLDSAKTAISSSTLVSNVLSSIVP